MKEIVIKNYAKGFALSAEIAYNDEDMPRIPGRIPK